MDRYQIGDYFSEGTNGSVAYAVRSDNKQKCVVKKIKKQFLSWEDAYNSREVQALIKLRHDNIVKLKEVVREGHEAFLIFEAMDGTLHHLIQSVEKEFSEDSIVNIMWQILQGLSYIHDKGLIHRNLTSENILCKVPNIIKIAGFSSVKDTNSRSPHTPDISDKVVRAPEMLLSSNDYSNSTDIWSAGTIMAHMYLRKPLFSGDTEKEYLNKICSILGTPDERYWPEGYSLAKASGYTFPKYNRRPLTRAIENASHQAVLLMHDMIRWVPARRPAATTCLTYPYFSEKASMIAAEERERSELSSASADSFRQRLRQDEIMEKPSPPKLSFYTSPTSKSHIVPSDNIILAAPASQIDVATYPPPRRLYRVSSDPLQTRYGGNEYTRLSIMEPPHHSVARHELHPDYYWDETRLNHDWHQQPAQRYVDEYITVPRRPRADDFCRSIPNDISKISNRPPIMSNTMGAGSYPSNASNGSNHSNGNGGGGGGARSGINSGTSHTSSTRPSTPNVHGRTNWAAKYLR